VNIVPRPREYDEVALLDNAMETFWSLGYERTSMEQLVATSGVNRASIYAAYENKRDLFLAGLQRYLDSIVEGNIRRLMEVSPASEAVRRFFVDIVNGPPERLRRGCLLINSAVQLGTTDPDAAALIRRAFARVERCIRDRLVEARDAGDTADGLDPTARARLLMTVLQGLRVMGRVGTEVTAMRDAVEAALEGIGARPKDKKGRGKAVRAGRAKPGASPRRR
jgi:TetR/AcrR family transcriptional regulator, transcriptional repressor for nem operon